jgi:Fanconi anemia group M protein
VGLVVVSDWREEPSGIPEALRARGVDVEVRHLLIADYVVSDRVVVERKSARDFDASVVDRRLFRQVEALKATYPTVIVLVVGADRDDGIGAEARRGALAWIVRHGVGVVWARDAAEAAAWLHTLASQEGKAPTRILAPGIRKATEPDAQLLQLVATLPGIGMGFARRLLEHFGRLEALTGADEAALREVPGIGPKRASTLAALFAHDYQPLLDADLLDVVPEAS